jgi:hypothetical protein
MPQALDPLPFQIDHIIAEQHHGKTERGNLALACLGCNKRKGPNAAGFDPLTGKLVPLFNPRTQEWVRHFRWAEFVLVGRTRTGRATITVLGINRPDYVAFREELGNEGRFPFRKAKRRTTGVSDTSAEGVRITGETAA